MLEELIKIWFPEICGVIEIFGMIVIAFGAVKAFYFYFASLIKKKHYPIKVELSNTLALGLEINMGAEILKTVVILNMNDIYVLVAIVLLRAALTFIIHFELKEESKHGKAEAHMNNY